LLSQINAIFHQNIKNNTFLEQKKEHFRMISDSEGSQDTENWSNDAENSALPLIIFKNI